MLNIFLLLYLPAAVVVAGVGVGVGVGVGGIFQIEKCRTFPKWKNMAKLGNIVVGLGVGVDVGVGVGVKRSSANKYAITYREGEALK